MSTSILTKPVPASEAAMEEIYEELLYKNSKQKPEFKNRRARRLKYKTA